MTCKMDGMEKLIKLFNSGLSDIEIFKELIKEYTPKEAALIQLGVEIGMRL